MHLYPIFIFLLGHLYFFVHFFFTSMENLFKKHPILVLNLCLSASSYSFFLHSDTASPISHDQRGCGGWWNHDSLLIQSVLMQVMVGHDSTSIEWPIKTWFISLKERYQFMDSECHSESNQPWLQQMGRPMKSWFVTYTIMPWAVLIPEWPDSRVFSSSISSRVQRVAYNWGCAFNPGALKRILTVQRVRLYADS